MKRNATAVWQGSVKEGTGLTTQSNTLANTQYSFKSRFEDGWVLIRRTNCSSTSGCFAMQLSAFIGRRFYS
jgi:osmotically inducible protein OsmC